MFHRARYWLAKRLLVSFDWKTGEEPRAIILARTDEMALTISGLERERDYWRGRIDVAVRRAEIAEDLVADMRRLTDDWISDLRRLSEREIGRGEGIG